jgi:hypothetical protein
MPILPTWYEGKKTREKKEQCIDTTSSAKHFLGVFSLGGGSARRMACVLSRGNLRILGNFRVWLGGNVKAEEDIC